MSYNVDTFSSFDLHAAIEKEQKGLRTLYEGVGTWVSQQNFRNALIDGTFLVWRHQRPGMPNWRNSDFFGKMERGVCVR